MKIQLAPGTTYVTPEGVTHFPGDVIEVAAGTAETLIRTGSAMPVKPDVDKEGEHHG